MPSTVEVRRRSAAVFPEQVLQKQNYGEVILQECHKLFILKVLLLKIIHVVLQDELPLDVLFLGDVVMGFEPNVGGLFTAEAFLTPNAIHLRDNRIDQLLSVHLRLFVCSVGHAP